jgi:hypothetical protein
LHILAQQPRLYHDHTLCHCWDMPDDTELLTDAKHHARQSVADLQYPDDDILPVMLFRGPYGFGLLPLPFGDDEEKDHYAHGMTASLVIARAYEAVFISTIWMVITAGKPLTKMPREHPDRVEAVMLTHLRVGHPDALYIAKLARRVNRAPDIGEWEDAAAGIGQLSQRDASPQFGGRFANAIHLAFDFIGKMPTELIGIIDEAWAAGEQADLIERFIKVHTAAIKSGQWPMTN